MKIRELPANVRSKLQSGLVITDAVQCVLELVYNSLDAEATAIAALIDLNKYKIQVVDNGRGIDKSDLELVGGRYMTSKHHDSDDSNFSIRTYGYKGMALSSILDVCKKLSIETKAEHGVCYVKVFENSKAKPIEKNISRIKGSGTTITVFDFLYTMPVRRKRINEVFDMEDIKNQLQYLAVIHNEVSFTLRNENKNLILLQKKSTATILQSITQIFKNEVTEFLKPITYQDEKFEISGFVSVKQVSRSLQLLYINKIVITKGVIHKFINNILKEYFANICDESYSDKVLKKIKKKCNNVFIMEIKCSRSCYEIFNNLRKTTVEFKKWKEVLKCVHKAIRRVFKSNESSSNSGLESLTSSEEVEKNDLKKKLGTSLLNNVVKGECVKRTLSEKSDLEKGSKKKKTLNSEAIFLKPKDKINELGPELKINKNTIIDGTIDSLESPIPKKCFAKTKNHSEEKNIEKVSIPNESFLEFYEWLKYKFEKDSSALNLYNEFLKVKKCKRKEEVKERDVILKSPVVGGKLKTMRNMYRKQTKSSLIASEEENVIDYKTKALPKNRPVSSSKVDNSIKQKNNAPKVNISPDHQAIMEVSNNCTTKFCYNKLLHQQSVSPALTNNFLKNLISFRNKTESSFIQMQAYQDMNVNLTQTWTSHYLENNIKNHLEDNLIMDSVKTRKQFDFFDTSVCPVKCQNVKVQTSFHNKRDAIVQTTFFGTADKSIQLSFCHENNVGVIKKKLVSDSETSFTVNNISQEVPYPDFWNLTPEKIVEKECESKKNLEVARPLSSNELNCVQEVNAKSQYTSSTSKETRTVAAMMTECLKEIGNIEECKNTESPEQRNFSKLVVVEKSLEKDNIAAEIGTESTEDNNFSKTENVKESDKLISNSESTLLPKTIPIEDIQSTMPDSVETGFYLTERHEFVPKGLSPKFFESEMYKNLALSPSEQIKIKNAIDNTENDLLASIKWQDESTGVSVKPTIPDGILDEMQLKAERNVIYDENEILTASLSYCAVKVHKLLHSFSFTKELLSHVEVLGQLDKKFIVAKIEVAIPKKMTLISLFDQHAVDERIKLEELLNEYKTPEGKLISTSTNPYITCELKKAIVRVIPNFEEKLKGFGLYVRVKNEKTVEIREIPKFLFDRHEENTKSKSSDAIISLLQALITNIVDEATGGRGTVTKVPSIIHNALCSEACSRAIKFNKFLTIENMIDMISKLNNCKLPFQCAHGRPSVIPIIDLEDFQMAENENLNQDSLKQFLNKRNQNNDTVQDLETEEGNPDY